MKRDGLRHPSGRWIVRCLAVRVALVAATTVVVRMPAAAVVPTAATVFRMAAATIAAWLFRMRLRPVEVLVAAVVVLCRAHVALRTTLLPAVHRAEVRLRTVGLRRTVLLPAVVVLRRPHVALRMTLLPAIVVVVLAAVVAVLLATPITVLFAAVVAVADAVVVAVVRARIVAAMVGDGRFTPVPVARVAIAVEVAVVAVVDHGYAARHIGHAVVGDVRVRTPAHAPVSPAPAPRTPHADRDADAESEAYAGCHEESRRRRGSVPAVPGMPAPDHNRVVVGHIDDGRVRRLNLDVCRLIHNVQLGRGAQLTGRVRLLAVRL